MKGIVPLVACALLITAPFVFAQEDRGLVPQGCQRGCPCTLCDFYNLGRNIIDFLLKAIAVPASAVMFLYGGVLMLTSGASEERIKQGRNAIKDAIIGLALAFFSYAIINVILSTLAFGIKFEGAGNPRNWFDPPACQSGSETSCVVAPEAEEAPPVMPVTPPGAVPPGAKSDQEARDAFAQAAGNKIDYNGTCPKTCLDGVSGNTISETMELQKDCGCALVISGGTEQGHSGNGPGTHRGGDKLDFRHSRDLDNFVFSNGRAIGKRDDGTVLYRVGDDMYANESNHWDVCFNNCREI